MAQKLGFSDGATADVDHRRAPVHRQSPALDADLRARFRDGDQEAVRAAYAAHGRLVYAVAHRILTDRGLCEEATQQTFLNAWRAAATVDPGRELGPWLATIARRVAIDIYRREALRGVRPLEAVPSDDSALITPAVAVEDVYDIWEVRRAVSLLPEGVAKIAGVVIRPQCHRWGRANFGAVPDLWHVKSPEFSTVTPRAPRAVVTSPQPSADVRN